jgi:uncharacterized repeat protein (TIGR03843 family)
MTSDHWLDDPRLHSLLGSGELEIEGRLRDASNTTLRCIVTAPDGRTAHCVYKPVAGERPLWDFPDRTLTRRELAAYEVSEALGWQLVPPTVWREDGPGGPGMCQLWIDEDVDEHEVAVVRPGQVPDAWREVLDAEDGDGRPVVLVHSSDTALVRMAVFDAIVNNADRKGGHILTDGSGRVWGIDHGVTFSVDDKLRTVLWGWAGEDIPDDVMAAVGLLHDILGDGFDPVDRWLDEEEREALRHRVRTLLRQPRFPQPTGRWPAIPWPVF